MTGRRHCRHIYLAPVWFPFFQESCHAFFGGVGDSSRSEVRRANGELSDQRFADGFVEHLFGHLV